MRLPRLSLTIKTKTFLQPKNHVCPVCYKAYCYEKPFCKHVALCNHEDQQPLLKRKSKKQNLVQALLIYLSLFSYVQWSTASSFATALLFSKPAISLVYGLCYKTLRTGTLEKGHFLSVGEPYRFL